MRHLFALLLIVGCSDPASDAPDALRGTCGEAPTGQQWIAATGCRLTCSPVACGAGGTCYPTLCQPDGGAPFCTRTSTDTANCGACGNDCRAFCAPTALPSCRDERCRCD